ncbi:MAG: gliding motility-associated C-terminal domain-containing protein [Bacteroidetes bacterium]|nr:gliding motility-associated C-terminal domain-containing protein [Bacteroidota bacterium]
MMRPFIIPLIISCWVFALPGISYAQDCDCAANDNCPATIPINSMGEICYDLTDAQNNDLANADQGVCGVQITFTHQHIWDLELWLVSPDGQTVQLIGPNINTFGTTNSVLWDVVFVPCSVNPVPDTVNSTPLEEEWTNNQNWPLGGFIGGSYLPYGGNCLESFDQGPANGEWCLMYENDPSTYMGEILNFEVILCDQSGILCCEAEAGSLSSYPDLLLCEGHPDLLLDVTPDYLLDEPDTLEYDYTFVISDNNGIILEYDTLPDLTTALPGTYTICGFSYRIADTLNIPDPNGIITIDSLRNYIDEDVNMLCGDITNNCIEVTIVAPPAPVSLLDTICDGEVYDIGGMQYTEAGSYEVFFQTAAQCDSLVNLDLTVIPLDTTNLSETICNDGSFEVGGMSFDQTGVYEVLLSNVFDCDSLVVLDLLVLDPIQTDLIDTICQGEIYEIGPDDFDQTGYYEVLLQTPLGCDSLVTLDLTVLDLQVVLAEADTITCLEPTQILDGTGTSSGELLWTTDANGEISGNVDMITALASSAGTYYLTVSQASCSASDSVEVIANDAPPLVEAGQTDSLTCDESQLILDGAGSSAGPEFTYLWTAGPGNILADETTLQPLIDQPGTYFLEVLNTETGCSATDSVEVINYQVFPPVFAGPGGLLTCEEPVYILDGSDSYNDDFVMIWTDSNGDPLVWMDSLEAEVTSPGWYYLSIENPLNGCVSIDSTQVEVNQTDPVIQLANPDTINCNNPQVLLDATGSDFGADFETIWTTQNGSTSGDSTQLQVDATSPGIYYFEVENIVSGCSSIDSVEVFIDTIPPMVEAGEDEDLVCGFTQYTIGVPSQTTQGPEIFYQWLDSNGAFIDDELQITVNTGDTYFLNVIDVSNGCTATDSVVVGQDIVFPVADIGMAGPLTCDMPVDTLGGPNTTSTADPFINFFWYDEDWQLIGTDSFLVVGVPGNYCFVVEDGQNNCLDTSCVVVLADNTLPISDPGGWQPLDCLSGEATLDGSNSTTGPNIQYTWTADPGTILSDPSQPTIEVSGLGIYYLLVEDLNTDCFTLDSVQTYIDTSACLPFAAAGLPGIINCDNFPNTTLDGSASESGPHITYLWNAISGTIVEGEDGLMPVVTAGEYELIVTNTVLNISAADTVIVSSDLDVPIAEAGPGTTLDCSTLGNNFNLDGTGSSVGPEFEYQWFDINGNPLPGGDGLMPVINAPGIYSIEVTDTSNGCTSSDAVLIELDGNYPDPCLVGSYQVDCSESTTIVGDTCASQNPDYLYEWTVSNGTILGPTDTALIEVDPEAPVTVVYLTVTDTTNFCMAEDSILVFPPTACFPDCEVAVPPVLTCVQDTISLDAGASSTGPQFEYEWTTVDGNLCGGETTLFPCVDAPGEYELVVTDTNNQFSCSVSIDVLEDLTEPLVEAGDDGVLTCVESSITLDATASQQVPGDVIQWIAPNAGCILSGGNTLEPVVNCAGTYYLTIIHGQTGCEGTDSVAVTFDTLSPVVVLPVPAPISCTNNPTTLDGSGSAMGLNIEYIWYLDGVQQNAGPNLQSLDVSEAGTWCLEVLNTLSGCSDSLCVEVFEDADLPQVDAGPGQVLTCTDTIVSLAGMGSMGAAYEYLWTGPAGCILSDPTQLGIDVNCTGTYTLTVNNTQTGCSDFSEVEVSQEIDPPFADAGPDQVLTCEITEAVLDGSNSAQATNLTYTWTAISGNVSGPVNQIISQADAIGLYQLAVEDTLGGCIGYDTVEVTENLLLPVANAGPDMDLTCAILSLNLDGSGSSQGDSIVYNWQAFNGGNILSGNGLPNPLVDATGTYVLEVQDTLNGCVALDTVLVGEDLSAPIAQIDSLELLELNCNTNTLQLLGENSQPFGELSFFWETPDGSITSSTTASNIFVDSSGTYHLIVELESTGCRDTASILVVENYELPEVVIAQPAALNCIVESVMLDASGSSSGPEYVAQWEAPAGSGALIQDDQSLSPTVFDALEFTLTITDQTNGCSSSGSVEVPIDTIPPVAKAAAEGLIDCDNLLAGLTGAGSSEGLAISYQWTGPGITSDPDQLDVEANMPGIYTLTVTDGANGCSAQAQTGLEALALPIYDALLAIDSASCFGLNDGSIVLDSVIGGSPPFLTSLNGAPFETYTGFYYLEPGQYEFTIMDLNGCDWTTSITITAGNDLTVDLGPDLNLSLGDSATLQVQLNIPPDQLDTLWWTPVADPDCLDCLEVVVHPNQNTEYTVTITDLKGCMASDDILLRVDSEVLVYFPNAFSPDGDGINDFFYPQSGGQIEQVNWLRIYDRWGNKVYEATDFSPNDPSFGWDGNFQGKPMNPAVFVFMAEVLTGNGSQKQVKGDLLLIR